MRESVRENMVENSYEEVYKCNAVVFLKKV